MQTSKTRKSKSCVKHSTAVHVGSVRTYDHIGFDIFLVPHVPESGQKHNL